MKPHARTPRRRSLLPVLALLALIMGTAMPAHARSADEYFRNASYLYVAGKIQEASVEAEEGLRVNPDDARLQALAEHLRKMKDQQRGGSGQDKNKDQNKDRDRNDGDDERKSEGKNEGKDDDKGDDKGDRPSDKDRENPEKSPPEEDPRRGDGGGESPQAGKMSEEEAKRLLNSFADDEKKEQAERRKVIRSRAGTEQDW